MYLGLKEHRFNIYIDKSIQSGWRYKMLHHYMCERCSYIARVLYKADEPFFCNCQHLIGIEPAREPSIESEQREVGQPA